MVLSRLISRSASWLQRLGHAQLSPPPALGPPAAGARQPATSAGAWHGAHAVSLPADPEAVVRAFIADYVAWNDRAWADCAEGSAADDRQVDAAYREAIGPHLAPGVTTLPAAFDGDSLHAPEREGIVDLRVDGDVAQVRTRAVARRGDAHRAFEYRLRRLGGRWALEAVDELHADGGRAATL